MMGKRDLAYSENNNNEREDVTMKNRSMVLYFITLLLQKLGAMK